MTSVDRIQGLSGSLAVKPPCRVATTANITLSGEQTIDGVAVVDGNRVLVKDQTDTTENGIYDASTGAWTRALDFDGVNDVKNGTLVAVTSGTAGGAKVFQVSGTDPITPGTTAITFNVSSVFTAISAFAATLLDDANAAAVLTTLGLTVNGQSLVTAANYAAMKALLDLEIGTDVQAQDATLAALAGLTLTQGCLFTATGADAAAVLAKGTAYQQLRMNAGATAPEWASPTVDVTAVATTSGAAVTLASGIPSGVKEIDILFDGVSTDTVATIVIIQIGDSGGFETSGYVGGAGSSNAVTNGFYVSDAGAVADTRTGCLTLRRMDSATNKWVASGSVYASAGPATTACAGIKSLSAELTQIQITTVAGTAAFDAGSAAVRYRF